MLQKDMAIVRLFVGRLALFCAFNQDEIHNLLANSGVAKILFNIPKALGYILPYKTLLGHRGGTLDTTSYQSIISLEDKAMAENVINTRCSKMWLDEKGIVREYFFPKTDFTIQDAKRSVALGLELSEDADFPWLIDMTNMKSITKEAREYFGKVENSHIKAVGLITNSPVSKVFGNFFLRFNKPSIPVRLFSSEIPAYDWLEDFLP